ncbi:MAG: hypothetical protein JXA03_16090 [Bacteroidales bacterium]|nr:hypothetical protein [Bacteroidales bacterium]
MKLINPEGLTFNFLDNGLVKSITSGPIRINLREETPFSGSGTQLFLRKKANKISFTPLLGPESNSRFKFEDNCYVAKGSWNELEYTCQLELSEKRLSWLWQVVIENKSSHAVDLDLVHLQDISLKTAGSEPVNEYYVSQYLERRILEDKTYGKVICCRQNMKESTGHPWLMMASTNCAASACTDGMLFYGKTFRETGIPEGLLSENLGGELAGESSVLALQEKPFTLAIGEKTIRAFVATYMPDHSEATSEKDLEKLPSLMEEFNNEIPFINTEDLSQPNTNLFNKAPFLQSDDLSETEINRFFGEDRRHVEKDNGTLFSFFSGKNNHVVLRAKEVKTDRPHAHIMQANTQLVPDENSMSTTAFAFGVFNSHITQGNTNFNVLLSICTSQFNQSRDSGQRIFIEIDGHYYLLGVPSAFEMGLNHCRWIYKKEKHCFEVVTWTSKNEPRINIAFKVLEGKPLKLLISHQFDQTNGWKPLPGKSKEELVLRPTVGSIIAGKFPDAQFRFLVQSTNAGYQFHGDDILFEDNKQSGCTLSVIAVEETEQFCMSIIGEVKTHSPMAGIDDPIKRLFSDREEALADWLDLSLNLTIRSRQKDMAAIQQILPWYGQNALIHYLTPYGLEQFGGAAWGTRDVSQGPVDLLLTLEKYDEARTVLCTIFSNQNPDGGWPQWWMFDSYHNIRADEAHGDIFYWCIIALSDYIKVTGDTGILQEVLPYYHEKDENFAEKTPLSEHVDRLVMMILDSFIPGTSLVPFGGGDWNDSLQPVSKELAQRLISSWTVAMNYQAFRQLREVYARTGDSARAENLAQICENIQSDFNKHLVRDGIVAGYGKVEDDGSISVLLHPSDKITGIRYSLLPMERGIISGIFIREQAEHHHHLIEQHLKGPDGARLMDRPLRYRGGRQEIFQRAESSTFFGREIGLMYVHEHIRYAELLARLGHAEAFVKALRQAIPIGYNEVVPNGDRRQANCYYSSSDVAFKNRYEADEHYKYVINGNYPLKGGWRIYSSGPGIYIGLVVKQLLGIRIESNSVVIDPVLPASMDGLKISIKCLGYPVTFQYNLKDHLFGPKQIKINGENMVFTREKNKYREGGAVILRKQFLNLLNPKDNQIEVFL